MTGPEIFLAINGGMNICINEQGPTLKSPFEHYFARAPYFVFYDSENFRSRTQSNGAER